MIVQIGDRFFNLNNMTEAEFEPDLIEQHGDDESQSTLTIWWNTPRTTLEDGVTVQARTELSGPDADELYERLEAIATMWERHIGRSIKSGKER